MSHAPTLQSFIAGRWIGQQGAQILRSAIAAHHGCTPAHVVVGEGIDGLLGLLVRLLIGPGDAVVTSLGAYPTFNFHVAGFGAALLGSLIYSVLGVLIESALGGLFAKK